MMRRLQSAALRRWTVRLSRASLAGKVAVLTAPAMIAGAHPARAQHLTGERFFEICHDRASPEWEAAGQWVCPSFIRGIIDGARLQAMRDGEGAAPGSAPRPMICDPRSAAAEEAITLVLRFLEARPETRPLPAAIVVSRALGEAWPCKP